MTEPTNLYRHFDSAGKLLYVGISKNALVRLGQHEVNAEWFKTIAMVTVKTLPTRRAAELAEQLAIEVERPLHNIRYRRRPSVATASEKGIPVSAPLPVALAAAQVPGALPKLQTVCAITGLSSATIYRKARTDPTFPKLIKLGTRCTRIRAGDLTNWMAAQAED